MVPVAILRVGRGKDLAFVFSDFILYLLVTPSFAVNLMRSMYIMRETQIAQLALDKIDEILEYP